MRFEKSTILDTMHTTGLVPLFTHDDAGLACEVVDAAYRGGVRVFEFTNRKDNSFDVFKTLVRHVTQYPDLHLGIGTVMNAVTTRQFLDAGADFIISPILKPEMAEVCKNAGAIWIPGCATLTEIVSAKELGADVIKIFPGSVMGPGFVSSITPVVPGLRLMITGGVEPKEENLHAWFKAGAMCVGMGSQLFTKSILEKHDWATLTKTIAYTLDTIRKVRASL